MQQEKEIHIQQAILELLALKNCHCWRSNSGALPTKSGGFVSFGTPGLWDISCIFDGLAVGLEVKRPGGRLSPAQESFHEKTRQHGGKVHVVHSVDETVSVLKVYGK